MRIFSDANYSFIDKRRKAYAFSGALILLAVLAMVANSLLVGSWQNYGVDFTGGSLIQVRFDVPVTAGDLRDALGGSAAYSITRFGEENEFTIRAPVREGGGEEAVANEIMEALSAAFDAGNLEVVRTELVGPKIGGELQQKAAMAIVFSFFLALIYLAIRFELRFGLAAIIATVHDITLTLGFLAIFRVEIALPTVAAILTVVGYSLNDTIVVFDRIRENLNKKGGTEGEPGGSGEPVHQRDPPQDGPDVRHHPGGAPGPPDPGRGGDPGLHPGAHPGDRGGDVLLHLRGLSHPPGDPEAVQIRRLQGAEEAPGDRGPGLTVGAPVLRRAGPLGVWTRVSVPFPGPTASPSAHGRIHAG
jgi:preprotein translocase SecF subunit